jgi:dihydropteroate synthase
MRSAGENKPFSRNYVLNIHGRLVNLRTPVVMGVINVTADSFFAASRTVSEKEIVRRAETMLQDGALILDVGAYSSRPGAADIPDEVERQRAVSAVTAICKAFPSAIVSVDTFRSAVARACLEAGASMVNDISGGEQDPEMFPLMARANVPYILMHMRGTPQTMATLNQYDNVMLEILSWLENKVAMLRELGVKDVIADPGFGFAKSIQQNFHMLNRLELFHHLECPLLVGISRKSMIWKTLQTSADDALNGTTVLNTIALLKGASILRVHDVRQAVEAIRLTQALN